MGCFKIKCRIFRLWQHEYFPAPLVRVLFHYILSLTKGLLTELLFFFLHDTKKFINTQNFSPNWVQVGYMVLVLVHPNCPTECSNLLSNQHETLYYALVRTLSFCKPVSSVSPKQWTLRSCEVWTLRLCKLRAFCFCEPFISASTKPFSSQAPSPSRKKSFIRLFTELTAYTSCRTTTQSDQYLLHSLVTLTHNFTHQSRFVIWGNWQSKREKKQQKMF